jgi:hypothetical protein
MTNRERFQSDLRVSVINALGLRAIDAAVRAGMTVYDALTPLCLANADVDEPVFVLRGQDQSAEETVAGWIGRNITSISQRKLAAAVQITKSMREWPHKKAAD